MSFYTNRRLDLISSLGNGARFFLYHFKGLMLQWIIRRRSGNWLQLLEYKSPPTPEFIKFGLFFPQMLNFALELYFAGNQFIHFLGNQQKGSQRSSNEIEKCLLSPLVINQTDVKDANSHSSTLFSVIGIV